MKILLPPRKFVTEVLERGGGRGGREGGITVQENDLGTQAISQRESRPDTTASIIQMTMANERDPNKSPLNSLREHSNISLQKIWRHYRRLLAAVCSVTGGKSRRKLDSIFISLGPSKHSHLFL